MVKLHKKDVCVAPFGDTGVDTGVRSAVDGGTAENIFILSGGGITAFELGGKGGKLHLLHHGKIVVGACAVGADGHTAPRPQRCLKIECAAAKLHIGNRTVRDDRFPLGNDLPVMIGQMDTVGKKSPLFYKSHRIKVFHRGHIVVFPAAILHFAQRFGAVDVKRHLQLLRHSGHIPE